MNAVMSAQNLRAYYKVNAFGVTREVRAVDDVTLEVGRNEIYGIAGESSSGKSSLVKTLGAGDPAAAHRGRRQRDV